MRMVYFAIILSLSLFVTDSFYQPHSTARCLPLLSLSLKASSSPDNNINSCVVLYDDDDEHNNNNELLADAEKVSKAIGIPLFFASNITTQWDEEFTHALRLIPYDYCGEQSTFALAIEPINVFSDDGSRRRKQQRRITKPKKYSSSSAFFVDLCPPENSRAGRRATGASGTSDLLIQAVAPRKGSISISDNGHRDGAVIYDLTAGLGQDSLFLAMNGAKHVHMVERNPIVGALLQDAMRRLQLISSSSFNVLSECNKSHHQQQQQQTQQTQKELATSLSKKLSLTIGEGKGIIQKQQQQQCDVIYLDPMFPTRQKQSAVKKGMTILHGLLENQYKSIAIDNHQSLQEEKEQEEQDLLLSALDAARLRVVVKRPIKAPLLGGGEIAKPSYAITGSVNRWDVYVKPQLSSSS
jgi:16S rRNA (guanine1516-N2)-methyltransferase